MRLDCITDSMRGGLTHLLVATSCALTAPRLQPDIIVIVLIGTKLLRASKKMSNHSKNV